MESGGNLGDIITGHYCERSAIVDNLVHLVDIRDVGIIWTSRLRFSLARKKTDSGVFHVL